MLLIIHHNTTYYHNIPQKDQLVHNKIALFNASILFVLSNTSNSLLQMLLHVCR